MEPEKIMARFEELAAGPNTREQALKQALNIVEEGTSQLKRERDAWKMLAHWRRTANSWSDFQRKLTDELNFANEGEGYEPHSVAHALVNWMTHGSETAGHRHDCEGLETVEPGEYPPCWTEDDAARGEFMRGAFLRNVLDAIPEEEWQAFQGQEESVEKPAPPPDSGLAKAMAALRESLGLPESAMDEEVCRRAQERVLEKPGLASLLMEQSGPRPLLAYSNGQSAVLFDGGMEMTFSLMDRVQLRTMVVLVEELIASAHRRLRADERAEYAGA